MPYQGEHAARIVDPAEFTNFRRQNNKFGRGIHVIFGIRAGGGSEVQAIRFDSSLFTVDEVQKWLRDHDYKPISTEPALEEEEEKEEAEGETPELTKRSLGAEISLSPDNLQDFEGGLLIKGVKLLAAGTWTDSAQKTPCRYTAATLEKYATNWADPSVWSRHAGGMPRDITEKVGRIMNPRFTDGAVAGDLFYHGMTSRSRDTIEMVKHRLANYVSVEIRTRDRWLEKEKIFEADEIEFDGVATVNRGACSVCTIRSQEGGKPDETPPITEVHSETVEAVTAGARTPTIAKALAETPDLPGEHMDEKEKELEARLKSLEEGFEKRTKALEEKITTRDKELELAKAELEKLKNTPVQKIPAGGEKELGEVETLVVIDRTERTVKGVR